MFSELCYENRVFTSAFYYIHRKRGSSRKHSLLKAACNRIEVDNEVTRVGWERHKYWRENTPKSSYSDDIIIFWRCAKEPERAFNELNEMGKKIGVSMNRKKTQFMKIPWCENEQSKLDDSPITATTPRTYFVYHRRSMNMENNLKKELDRRRRAAWRCLRAHSFDSTFFPVLCYAAETHTPTMPTILTPLIEYLDAVSEI